ncbi:hypothetical protein DFJ74DRAFT_457345, partial [Hyaloraphidium curvatum]
SRSITRPKHSACTLRDRIAGSAHRDGPPAPHGTEKCAADALIPLHWSRQRRSVPASTSRRLLLRPRIRAAIRVSAASQSPSVPQSPIPPPSIRAVLSKTSPQSIRPDFRQRLVRGVHQPRQPGHHRLCRGAPQGGRRRACVRVLLRPPGKHPLVGLQRVGRLRARRRVVQRGRRRRPRVRLRFRLRAGRGGGAHQRGGRRVRHPEVRLVVGPVLALHVGRRRRARAVLVLGPGPAHRDLLDEAHGLARRRRAEGRVGCRRLRGERDGDHGDEVGVVRGVRRGGAALCGGGVPRALPLCRLLRQASEARALSRGRVRARVCHRGGGRVGGRRARRPAGERPPRRRRRPRHVRQAKQCRQVRRRAHRANARAGTSAVFG